MSSLYQSYHSGRILVYQQPNQQANSLLSCDRLFYIVLTRGESVHPQLEVKLCSQQLHGSKLNFLSPYGSLTELFYYFIKFSDSVLINYLQEQFFISKFSWCCNDYQREASLLNSTVLNLHKTRLLFKIQVSVSMHRPPENRVASKTR